MADEARKATRTERVLANAVEAPIGSGPGAQPAPVQQCVRPARSGCASTYDAAHAALRCAVCLVVDTETSGFNGCVLDMGWIIADSTGAELASHSKLWRLPPSERIHSKAYQAHRISADTLRRNGSDPSTDLAELFALISAAIALGVCVVAHNASFDVRALNTTAVRHKVKLPPSNPPCGCAPCTTPPSIVAFASVAANRLSLLAMRSCMRFYTSASRMVSCIGRSLIAESPLPASSKVVL